jgi:hypothetical protein
LGYLAIVIKPDVNFGEASWNGNSVDGVVLDAFKDKEFRVIRAWWL